MDLDKLGPKIVFTAWGFAVAVLMYCGNSAFIYAQF